MPLPTLSHATHGTVTFSKAYLATSGPLPPRVRQRTARTDAGGYLVATLGSPDQDIPLEFSQLPSADVTALATFLDADHVNGAATVCTFTDLDSTTYSVRVLDWDPRRLTPTLWDVTLLLAVEPG